MKLSSVACFLFIRNAGPGSDGGFVGYNFFMAAQKLSGESTLSLIYSFFHLPISELHCFTSSINFVIVPFQASSQTQDSATQDSEEDSDSEKDFSLL